MPGPMREAVSSPTLDALVYVAQRAEELMDLCQEDARVKFFVEHTLYVHEISRLFSSSLTLPGMRWTMRTVIGSSSSKDS